MIKTNYNWQTKKLGEICDIINGSTPLRSNKEFWESGDISWFTIDDIREQGRFIKHTKQKITKKALSKTRLLPIKTILLCCTASIGEYALTEIELTTNQQFNGLVIKNQNIIDPKFLFYFSSTLKDQLFGLSGKSTIDFIPISRLKEIEIPLPPILEQNRIVKILDEVFEATAKAKENAEKNLQNAKELFESYLQNIFANPGYDWEEKKLGDIAEIEYGFTDKAKDYGEFRYVRITDIDNYGHLEPRNKMYIKYSKEAEKFLLNEDDLLMARTGATFAKVLLYKNIEKSIFASYLIRIKFTEKIINKLYWYFSKSKFYWDQAIKLSSGSAQPQFNGGALKQLIFRFPKSISGQQSIVAKLDALSAETKKLETIYKQKLADLEELKKSVLKKAFSGEL